MVDTNWLFLNEPMEKFVDAKNKLTLTWIFIWFYRASLIFDLNKYWLMKTNACLVFTIGEWWEERLANESLNLLGIWEAPLIDCFKLAFKSSSFWPLYIRTCQNYSLYLRRGWKTFDAHSNFYWSQSGRATFTFSVISI